MTFLKHFVTRILTTTTLKVKGDIFLYIEKTQYYIYYVVECGQTVVRDTS